MLAALAYQESGLDHHKKSKRGAIGIMQVLPSTAADSNVNIRNIHNLENNIHAGTKYLNFLRSKYFSKHSISPADQINLSFAAYNAGPRKVQQMRRKAKSMGLNPNKWFSNVERAALRMVGQETVRYVSNINKYTIAYRLIRETRSKRAKEREALKRR